MQEQQRQNCPLFRLADHLPLCSNPDLKWAEQSVVECR